MGSANKMDEKGRQRTELCLRELYENRHWQYLYSSSEFEQDLHIPLHGAGQPFESFGGLLG